MKTLTLFEKLAKITSPYPIDQLGSKKLLIDSIALQVERMLTTKIGTVITMPDYGMDEIARINQMLGSQNTQKTYLNTLGQRITKADPRISSVSLKLEQHLEKKSKSAVPFIELKIIIRKSLGIDEYGEPYSFKIAFDMLGQVYRLRDGD